MALFNNATLRVGAVLVAAAYLGSTSVRGDVFDIYVDSVNGNNSNTGASPAQAKQTLSSIAFTNQLKVGLARGSEWREQISIGLAQQVTIAAYGVGERPIIRGDDAIDAIAWTKDTSYTHVYKTSITLSSTNTIYTNTWENEAWLSRAASIAACDATPGTYYLSEVSTSTTLYVHPSASDNPTINGKTYNYTKREYAILGNASAGSKIDGIWTKRSLSQNASLFIGNQSVVRNCRVSDGSKHNLFVQEGSLVEDCIIDNAYYGSNPATLFVCYNAAFTGLGLTVRRTECVMPSTSTIVGGFLSHDSSATSFIGDVVADDLVCTNLATGVNFGRTSTQIINNPTVYNCSTGINADCSLTVNNGTLASASGGQCVGISKPNVTVSLMGGSYTANGGAANLIRSLSQANSKVTLTGITVSRANGWMVQMTGVGAELASTNNNFMSVGFGHYDISQTGSVITSDYNTFGTVSTWRIQGVSHTSIAAWRVASGQDQNSVQI